MAKYSTMKSSSSCNSFRACNSIRVSINDYRTIINFTVAEGTSALVRNRTELKEKAARYGRNRVDESVYLGSARGCVCPF